MKKTTFLLTAIAAVLASTTALVAISDVAAARSAGGGHQTASHQTNPQSSRQIAMGTPSRDMTRKPPVYQEKGSKSGNAHGHKTHKSCGKLIVPTAGCAAPAHDPVGNTRPSLPTEAKKPVDKSRQPVVENVTKPGPQSAAQPANAPAQPAAAPARVVAVSNGVAQTTLDPGKGLTVSSTGNGAISVSNGTNTVTLAGGSVTLRGAPAVTPGAGVQVVRLSNGDYSVAAKPVPAAPAAPADKVPPGVTIADDAKFVGHGLSYFVTVPAVSTTAVVGAPVAAAVGAIQGHPVKTLEKYFDSVGKELTDIFE